MEIYLFYGNNYSIIEDKINNIILKNNIDANNVIKYDMENNLDNIIEELSMNSLFGDKKAVIVDITFKEEVDDKKIEEFLDKSKNNSNILIFNCANEKIDTRRKIYKIINKYGKIEELNKNHDYVVDYIKKSLQDNNKSMDINYFLSKVNDDLDNIKNELDKLILYKINDSHIENSDIDNLVIPNIEEEIFVLSDSVIKKDKKKSIELYQNFLNRNYEPIYIISLLGSQFHFLYQVKRLYNQNKSNDEIASILSAHPYRVKLTIQNSYIYTEEILLKKIYELANMDKNIKLGNIDKNLALEMFLVEG